LIDCRDADGFATQRHLTFWGLAAAAADRREEKRAQRLFANVVDAGALYIDIYIVIYIYVYTYMCVYIYRYSAEIRAQRLLSDVANAGAYIYINMRR